METIEKFLVKHLSDASEECRREARQAWFEFERLFPFQANGIRAYLDGAVVKAIEDEERGEKTRFERALQEETKSPSEMLQKSLDMAQTAVQKK